MSKLRVGIVGLGGMGRTHFSCYQANPDAEVVALCDLDEDKRTGKWGEVGLNIGTIGGARADIGQMRSYADYRDLVRDPEIDIVDVCTPTPVHTPVVIAALEAGKDVMTEKPIGYSVEDAREMVEAAQKSGRKLMVGHCLRFWPQYVKAHEILASADSGTPVYASFHRSGGTPMWSSRDWLRNPDESGGAVLDMHIHDVDTALWWFGKPSRIDAHGLRWNGLPTVVDASWVYDGGPLVFLHGSWDPNGGPFRYAFQIRTDKITLSCDSNVESAALFLTTGNETHKVEVDDASAYQLEIDDFVACVKADKPLTRVTPQDALAALEAVWTELKQM